MSEFVRRILRHRIKVFTLFTLTVVVFVVVFCYIFTHGGIEGHFFLAFPSLDSVKPDDNVQVILYDRVGESRHNVYLRTQEPSTKIIAIGGGLTSRYITGLSRANAASKFVFFNTFMPSFCSTASPKFIYNFYLAFDKNDRVFSNGELANGFKRTFAALTMQLCYQPRGVRTSLTLIQCNHSGRPAWAQNDAMMVAYLDHADYYYRINDDTRIITGSWTEAFIDVIDHYNPPHVGVVGPNHRGGNQKILTYDFVHRTHIDLFGFYYPRMFGDWSADRWITEVYQPSWSTKLNDVLLDHTMFYGQRYVNRALGGRLSAAERTTLDRITVQRHLEVKFQMSASRTECKEVLPYAWPLSDTTIRERYIAAVHSSNDSGRLSATSDGRRVIAMSLFGRNPRYLWGAIRNAQLVPVHFPGWKLRVYVPSESAVHEQLAVPPLFVDKLRLLGANVVHVAADEATAQLVVSPRDWRLLAADNLTIEYFLIRDADARLTDRDAAAVADWIRQVDFAKYVGNNHAFPVHCMFDHPNHANRTIVDGLWGGRPSAIRHYLKSRLADALYEKRTCSANSSQLTELEDCRRRWQRAFDDVIGSFIRDDIAFCHCNITRPCRNIRMASTCVSRSSHQFPVGRAGDDFVGRKFDQHQQPLTEEGQVKCDEK